MNYTTTSVQFQEVYSSSASIPQVVLALALLVCVVVCVVLAGRWGRSRLLWGLLGLVIGPLAVIALVWVRKASTPPPPHDGWWEPPTPSP
jgi:hypothetical protein